MSEVVRVRAAVLEELLAAARGEPQLECCGLLAGRDGLISLVLPARNALASAAAFYPSAAYFILSPLLDAPQPVRAFRIRDGQVSELTLQSE